MSLFFQRLASAPLISEAEAIQRLYIQTEEGIAAADVGTVKTFFNATLDTRLTALESGAGTPSYWPVARTLTLAGPFTGSVSIDGSQDITLTVGVPAGALTTTDIQDLTPTLFNLRLDVDDQNSRLIVIEDALDAGVNVASADTWSTARILSLTGKAAGSVSIDGSADVSLNVTGLTVTKSDVGLFNVDNTSDEEKPISLATQVALDAKAPAGDYLMFTGSIPSAADLDTYLETGLFHQGLTANAASGSHYPVAVAGMLTVTAASSMVYQSYQVYNSGQVWTRTKYQSAWSPWLQAWNSLSFDPDTKASLNASVSFAGSVTSRSAGLVSQATATSNAHVWLRDEAGVNEGLFYWDRATDQVIMRRYNAAGTGGEGELQIGVNTLSFNDNEVWHAGTFNPASKLNTTGTAAAAAKLATARAISLAGPITAVGVNFDGTGNIALTTAIADGAIAVAKIAGLQSDLNEKANLSGPAFSGVPTTPTAAVGNSTTQIASTAFVSAEIANDAPTKTGGGASGSWGINVTGNAGTATRLATARTFSLSGVITAPGVSFDGSGNLALATVIADSALSIAKTSGLSTALASKVDDSQLSEADLGSTVVKRTASADINARLFRSMFGDQTTIAGAIPYRVNNTTDPYIRFCNNGAAVRNWMGLGAADGVSFGTVGASRFAAGFDAGVANSISCSAWFRSSGNTGWHSETWGIGIFATDATYVRTYGSAAMAAADFVISSDERLKTAVTNFNFKGRLRPVNFVWKKDGSSDFGFIAQEVELLYPDAVGEIAGNPLAGEPELVLQLSYHKLTAVLSYQVNTLEDITAQMRSEIDTLKEQVAQLLAMHQS